MTQGEWIALCAIAGILIIVHEVPRIRAHLAMVEKRTRYDGVIVGDARGVLFRLHAPKWWQLWRWWKLYRARHNGLRTGIIQMLLDGDTISVDAIEDPTVKNPRVPRYMQ